jgi:hypothetical protein
VGGLVDMIFGGGGGKDEGSSYQPPPEDPSIAQRREDEQRRAEQDRVRAKQEELNQATKTRNRKFGTRSMFGVPTRPSNLGAG